MAKKSSSYWKKRFEQLEEAGNSYGQETYQKIEPAFEVAQRNIQGKIEAWYGRFAANNNISISEARKMLPNQELKELKWDIKEYIKYGQENALNGAWMKELENASARYHISRLEALKLQTQQALEVAYGNELDTIDTMMKKIYSEGYYHTIYEVQRGFNIGWDIGKIDNNKLEKIISKPWAADGKNFSSRVWTSKTSFINDLHTELTRNIILGKAPDEAIKNLSKFVDKKFKNAKIQAGRLVMTEQSYFSSAAQKDAFNDLDVEKYEIVATLDSHTSDICQELDGQVFDMKDYQPGVTAPPFHVWCRTTTVPWFYDNFGERAARGADGKTYYVPSNINYKEWKETFVVEPNLAKEMYDLKDKLNNFEVKEYKNIWKDDVTTLDYIKKKHSITAKRDYLEHKFLTTTGEEQDKFQNLINDLNEFETQGKLYYEMKSRADGIRDTLTEMRTGSTIKDNPYTVERKDAAYWFINQNDADKILRPKTGELWNTFMEDEKSAAYEYTSGSGKFNRPLRGFDGSWYNYKGVGNVPLNREGAEKQINDLTNALSKSSYDFDIWLQRGIENSKGVTSFLGISESELINSDTERLNELLIDKVVKDEAFVSTAACKGKGFNGYIFNIYAPKGTNMIYAEPFSAYGNGSKLSWDGFEKQSSFGHEFEVILQKGYEYRITKVEKSNNRYYFDLEVILPER
nr:minor capsid protein [uncultured Anaerocolumna sp.]